MYRFSFIALYRVQLNFTKNCVAPKAWTCYLPGMPTEAQTDTPLYMRIAEGITQRVATGSLRSGDRVPSLR